MAKSRRARKRLEKLVIEHLEKENLKDDLIGTILEGDGVEIAVESQENDIDIDVLADKVADRLEKRGYKPSRTKHETDESTDDNDIFQDDADVDLGFDAETSFGAGELDEDD